MSDPTGGDDAAEDQQQGRWLGAVRSWIGGAEEGAPAEGGAPAPASSPALSADEIRRRRLERMGGSNTDQVGATTVRELPQMLKTLSLEQGRLRALMAVA